ncbi:MAG TPA: LytTR family DNA-binding domain-containing protein [Membranihabitans sp.]|nr:LytTR family DNA-binding domain-containing protein [Membranihabitans sp.]
MDCIIIEDQAPARRILEKYISDIGTLQLKAAFTDALSALDFLRNEKIDLIFLDIHLPKMSGIDFLKSLSHPPRIILTTAFQDYALEGYELDVVDYLLKPFSFQRFVKAVTKAMGGNQPAAGYGNELTQKTTPNELFIKSGYEYIKIHIPDILYIKADSDYTEIYLEGKKHLTSESLNYWEGYLDADQFARIHKSYIVNVVKIQKIVGNQIYLIDQQTIPIGRVYKDPFMEKFIN